MIIGISPERRFGPAQLQVTGDTDWAMSQSLAGQLPNRTIDTKDSRARRSHCTHDDATCGHWPLRQGVDMVSGLNGTTVWRCTPSVGLPSATRSPAFRNKGGF